MKGEKMKLFVLIVIIGILVSFLFYCFERWKKRRIGRITIREIDYMNGHDFEKYLEAMFTQLGYQASKTKGSGDFGVDLVLKKDGHVIVAQVKRYKSKVNLKAVQEVVSGKYHYKANEAWVITNSFFTESAKTLAKSNDVKLINRKSLQLLMKAANY